MQETLIEFETGKLAKEKNFNIPCDARWWMEFGSWRESKQGAVKCKNSEEYSISRPTQSLLQKWLREVHNIHLMVEPFYNEHKILVYGFDLIIERTEEETVFEEGFKTYEEALEEGLQEALKLIEIVKEKK